MCICTRIYIHTYCRRGKGIAIDVFAFSTPPQCNQKESNTLENAAKLGYVKLILK